MPKPGYINTPYGPVPISEFNKGPTFSSGTAKTFSPGQVVGGYIDWSSGLCKPIIPNPVVGKNKTTDTENGGASGSGKNNLTKTANSDIYFTTENMSNANLALEERVAFMSLTSNEILEIARNFDMLSDSKTLNRNISDSTNIVNSTSPINIISTQNSNTEYLNNSTKTIDNTTVNITQTTGSSTISLPPSTVSSSATSSNVSNSSSGNTTQVKVEVQAPTTLNSQPTIPPFKIISISPTSAKRGATITVTHEKCNATPRTIKIGTVTVGSSMKTKTFTIKIPTATSGSNSLAIGSSYKVYVTINGITVESAQSITILA